MSKIKEARQRAGLTQEEMSRLLEIPKRTIGDWETGNRTPPPYVEKLVVAELQRMYPVEFQKTDTQKVYPVVLTPDELGGYCVHIPDFGSATQGNDLFEAIIMARDAIGLMGITLEDENETIPEPRNLSDVKTVDEENGIFGNENSIVTLVDIDFAEYRRQYNNLTDKADDL